MEKFNIQEFALNVCDGNLEKIKKGISELGKEDFYYQSEKDNNNTILHNAFFLANAEIVTLFVERMKALGISKEEFIKLLEIQNEGGYNVIDKLLQFEDDNIGVILDRVEAFLNAIKTDREMLEVFLSVKGEEGSIYETLIEDEDILETETNDLLNKIHVALLKGNQYTILPYMPSILVKNKDLIKRGEIFNKHFGKNALVAQLKESALEVSLKQSEEQIDNVAGINVASVARDAKVKQDSIKHPTKPSLQKPSADAIKQRITEEENKLNDFFKKSLKDSEIKQNIEKEFKDFCGDNQAAAAQFKQYDKFLKKGFVDYLNGFAELKRTAEYLQANPLDTEEGISKFLQYFATKRVTKNLDAKIAEFSKDFLDQEKSTDIAKICEVAGIENDIQKSLEEFAVNRANFQNEERENVDARANNFIQDSTYHAAETANIVAYNKEHILWAVNKLGYNVSLPAAADLAIESVKIGSAAAISGYIASPMPVVSALTHSLGGVSGVAETIMGEEHVDNNADFYIGSNVILNSVVTGLSLCHSFKGANKAACFAGVFAIDVASVLSESVANAYSLFSTGLMAFTITQSDLPTAYKAVEAVAVSTRAVHEMSDVMDKWYPSQIVEDVNATNEIPVSNISGDIPVSDEL